MTITAPPPTSTRHLTGFWFVAAAFVALMAFGTAPTPLWPLYQARDHFGPTTVTIAFAVMVLGAGISLRIFGHLSDRLGRRRIIVPALLIGILADAILAIWPQLPALLLGRVLTGVAIGLMACTATTYLTDLYREARPDASSTFPALVATASNLGGLALGPLIAGALGQWAPSPLRTPYVVLGVLMIGLLALVLSSPETVDTELAEQDPPVRFALRDGQQRAFAMAALTGATAFAVMGLFSSLGVIVVRRELGVTSYFVAALAPFVVFAASAVAQLALARVPRDRILRLGSTLFPIGLILTGVALAFPALWLLLIAATLAGAGAGLLFKSAVAEVVIAAEPTSRAGVLATFFVIAYLGMGLPSIVVSLLI
ncbi:MFS transporter [Kribbella sandramycini]|uniref:MFS family permease n=1 Tax=Kribbella sandramycini TaxID=60450 RepID=A0A7Y4P137_9ACTN|nr:MFS transporter [Kribbella sandramycini]MBB6565483.1 MFS family permease [Kribbella sandramycini]NOL41750.1 MFS transporter [Kribbella sandramycini]